MPRGGFRPGAGRKPKPKPVVQTVTEGPEKVDPDGFKADPAWPFGQERPESEEPKPDLSKLTPLEYLLSVMRDSTEEKPRRMQAASLAAPYMHARKAETTKKEDAGKAAKQAATGKFKSAAPPKLVVNNK